MVRNQSLSPEALKEAISPFLPVVYGIQTKLEGRDRYRSVVVIRMIYAKLCRNLSYSLTKIGSMMARDHSVVIYYLRQFDNLIETDFSFRAKYFEILHHLKTIYPYESSVMDYFNQTQCYAEPDLLPGLLSA